MTLAMPLQNGLVGHWTCDSRDISNGILYDRAAVDQPDATINGGGSYDGQYRKSDW